MKTIVGLLVGLSMALAAQAQVNSESTRLAARPASPQTTPWTIVGRTANSTTHARVTYLTNRFRQVIARTNGYTELETGMHYFEDGQWKKSSAEIEITKDGAVANKTRHKVSFDGNINSAEAVTLVTPEGKELKSHILGLSYESADGKSVLIAETKDSQGLLLPSKNKVIYPDAFDFGETGGKADIIFEVTKAGLSQSVIFREQPPSPSEWGMDNKTVKLQVLTEFLDNPPEPVKEQVVVDQQTGLTDERLDFGEMKLARGKCFALGAAANQKSGVPVVKQWTILDGRRFLIESVQYKRIESSLKTLPEKPQASLPDTTKFQNLAGVERKLPALPAGKSDKPVELAQLDIYSQPGFVLDYEALASSTNFTFKGDTTYFCSGDVYLDGTTTIESSTVVKFGRRYSSGGMCGNDDPAGTISFNGPIDCKTTAYRPAIFTAMDDDSVGSQISGSVGTPNGYFCASGYYGGNWSEFHGGDNDVLRVSENGTDLRHLRVSWLMSAFRFPESGDVYLRDIQMLNCFVGMKGGGNLHIQNGLFANLEWMFWCVGGSEEERSDTPVNVRGENLTIDGCANFAFGYASYNLIFLTNSLLLGVPDQTYCTLTTDHTAEVDGSAFQSVGAGNYYLADGTYRNAGTTNISPWLLAELKKTTTYPPTILTNAITTNTTLSLQALRDTNALPALGYHYNPIDYAVNNLAVSNATLTVEPGTVIATFGSSGIRPWNNAHLVSEGDPLNHIHFVRYYAVQEQPIFWGDATNLSSTTTILPVLNASPLPTASFRFTDFDGMSYSGYHIYNADNAGSWRLSELTLQDCTANSGTFEMENLSLTANTVIFRNNLFERSACNFQNNLALNLRNNLWKGGATYFFKLGTNEWNITDNAFDRCDVSEPILGSIHSHNAYIATDGRLNGMDIEDPHDIVLTNFTYATGPLGNFYQFSTNLINAGSDTATNAGLYHYTVTTNQQMEGNSMVDIGFHFVALNANGVPMDSDTNNVPDYAADREYRQSGAGGGDSQPKNTEAYCACTNGVLCLKIHRFENITNATTNVVLTLHNTQPNLFYQIQTKTNLANLDWTPGEIFTNTAGLTNITFTPVPTTNRMMSFRAVGSDTLVSISRFQDAIEPNSTNQNPGQVGAFVIQRTNINGTAALSNSLTVLYRISGTASNDVDYTDDFGSALTNFAMIPADIPHLYIDIIPRPDNLIELDETVTLTLVPSTNYVILPGAPPLQPAGAAATITISDPPEQLFTTVASGLDRIGGIDFHPPTRSLLLSTNFNTGSPNFFVRIDTNGAVHQWSGAEVGISEVKIAVVKNTNAGPSEMFFTNGAMFFGNNSDIGWLSADAAVSNLVWVRLTNSVATNDTLLRGSLYVDQSGIFGGDLIAVTGSGEVDAFGRLNEGGQVWRINSERIPTLFVAITNDPARHLEGVITLPNNVTNYGPWAGKIITGASSKNPPLIHAIDTNGVVTDFAVGIAPFGVGIAPEDFDIIPTNQDLYCLLQNGTLLKLSHTFFTNNWNDILITQAGEGGTSGDTPRLCIVHWDNSTKTFVTKTISRLGGGTEFEHVTFAPINIQPP